MKRNSITAPVQYTAGVDESDIIDSNVLNPPIDARFLTPIPAPATKMTWADYYASQLSGAMGYAWAVGQNGKIIESGASGQARSAAATDPEAWSTDVISNLASVSKTVCAVAIMTEVKKRGWSFLDEYVWDYLSRRYNTITPSTGTNKVSIGDLLTMTSGLTPDQTLSPPKHESVDEFLQKYLYKPLVQTPGHFYDYANTSFTILQALYTILLDEKTEDYAALVQKNVLGPMGVTGFTTDPPAGVALCYSGSGDTGPGLHWGKLRCEGPAGWLASATQTMEYMNGIRRNDVLDTVITELMFTAHLGWYPWGGKYGVYYHHNGGLHSGAEGLSTGVMHFTDGWDGVLLVNTPVNIIPIMAAGFDATR